MKSIPGWGNSINKCPSRKCQTHLQEVNCGLWLLSWVRAWMKGERKSFVLGDKPWKLCWRQITESVEFQARKFGLYFVGSEQPWRYLEILRNNRAQGLKVAERQLPTKQKVKNTHNRFNVSNQLLIYLIHKSGSLALVISRNGGWVIFKGTSETSAHFFKT